MHPAIEGALYGIGVGAFLVGAEYLLLRNSMKARADRLKRKLEFDVTERRRISSMTRFALVLPVAFALGFWILA